MALDRTAFNALIDDDGSNTTGTPWNKAQIDAVLMDPTDAEIARLDAKTPPVPGATTQVLFNDAGALGADPGLTFNKTPAALTLGGLLTLTAGQLKFPTAQNASADATTLDDYREGTWAPVDVSGGGLAFSNYGSSYIKIGSLVMASTYLGYPATASGLAAIIGGLPFVIGATFGAGVIGHSTYSVPFTILGDAGVAYVRPYQIGAGNLTNAQLSGHTMRFTLLYQAA